MKTVYERWSYEWWVCKATSCAVQLVGYAVVIGLVLLAVAVFQ